MVQISVLSGNKDEAEYYFLETEKFIRLRGLKRRKSRKVRLLHHCYVFERLSHESSFTDCRLNLDHRNRVREAVEASDASIYSVDNLSFRLTSWRDLDQEMLKVKGQEEGENDLHLQHPGIWSATLYPEIFGVPELHLFMLSLVIRLAREKDESQDEAMPLREFMARAKAVERWIKQLHILRQSIWMTEAPVDTEQQRSFDLLNSLADTMQHALSVYFYRRIYDLDPNLQAASLGLREVLKELQQAQTQIPTGNTFTAESEARISTLASSCIQVINELVEKLDKIKIHDNGGRMDTTMIAFRAMWKEDEISKLSARIDEYRRQLGIDVLVSMRTHLVRSLDTQQAILSQLKTKGHNSTQHDSGTFGGTVINYVSSYVPIENRKEEALRLKGEVQDAIRKSPYFKDYGGVVKSDYPAYSISDFTRVEAEKKLISSLRYKEMNIRELTIAEPYEDTFRWILETDNAHRRDTKLKEWLSSESQLYWITGKAGSGKSTLMKFLGRLDGGTYGSDLCKTYLKTWASSADKLVLASFYFWAAGSSILFEQNPQIIPRVAALEWEEYCIFNQHARFDTSDHQLQVLLHDAVKALVQQEKAKVCFFIDGLDEYGGDPNNLISTIQNLLELGNIKICVSSRPWLVFEDAFLQAPNLLLQDYTQPDILHYVGSQLNQNEGFARLEKRDPQYASALIDSITTKSSGVFLWFRLVVNSLLAGLTHDDRISDLQRRLDLLPPDLEALYATITESLDPFYFAHAAQYFKFVATSSSPPSALLFSLADEESPNFALDLPVKCFTKDEEEIRIDTTISAVQMCSRAWTMRWDNMTAIYNFVQQISPS
ncbi:hypothetical protein FPSE5266_02409 [Fusarium pseudograminearum]|nr:hypothetical protein FPSE5266_02409 [Fusarium pseudograminearum]